MIAKIIKYSFTALLLLVLFIAAYVFVAPLTVDTTKLPENYGKVNSKLYVAEGNKQQPLFVFFGGSEGGNSMAKQRNISERKYYTDQGYAVLGIGYFGMEGIPEGLDRISLNAIYEEIVKASKHPNVNASCIVVAGASKGAELALILASKYPKINAAVSLVGSHAVFAGTSMDTHGQTSSFMFNDEPVPFIPLSVAVLPSILVGDYRKAYEIVLEDEQAVQNSIIRVEDINGPVLLISGEKDHIWPSKEMSDEVINRLESQNFPFPYEHIAVPNGDHFQPSSEYHHEVVRFLNNNLLPKCHGNKLKAA